jgi:hypothetical protein
MPTVTTKGMISAESEQVHIARAKAVADFFDVDVLIEDGGKIEVMTLTKSNGEHLKLFAMSNPYDGGWFHVKTASFDM